jgi:hypothetical protein
MRAKHVAALAAGLVVLGALPRRAAAQKPQVEQPPITVYKVPT